MAEVPHAAITLAKRFEGFHRVPQFDPGRAHPYVCPGGFWTVGYGHLCESSHPPITETDAEDYLMRDLTTALNATLRYCPVLAAEPGLAFLGRIDAVEANFVLNFGRVEEGEGVAIGNRDDSTLQLSEFSSGMG